MVVVVLSCAFLAIVISGSSGGRPTKRYSTLEYGCCSSGQTSSKHF